MRTKAKIRFVIFVALIVAFTACKTVARAQQDETRSELAFEYNYVRSNAPPGGCGCLGLHGASGSFAWAIKPGTLDVVGELGITHGASISGKDYTLTLSTYTAGVRYHPHLHFWRLRTYGEVLLGAAHAGGTLIDSQNSPAANSGSAFAAIVGGGVDWRITKNFSARLLQADYLLTKFNNGANDRQNNLRLGAGVVFHF